MDTKERTQQQKTGANRRQQRYAGTKRKELATYLIEYRGRPEVRRRLLLAGAKGRAKKYGLEFNITIDDIILPIFCPVLGIELCYKSEGKGITGRGGKDATPSLDRRDNKKGYIRGNVHVISNKANRQKGTLSADELQALADYAKNGPNTW